MKVFIAILLAASASASFDKDDKEMDAGFCLDHKTTGAICLAGSSLADKMPAAFEACFGGEVAAAGRRRGNGGRGKGGKKGPRCPSFDKIMGKVQEKFADEACVLKQLGWIDEEGNELKDAIEADIATLNEKVQFGISEEGVEECVAEIMEEMDGKYAKCADKYTEEEKATLEEVGVKIASFKCFMGMFKESCGNFIKVEYVEPLVASLTSATATTVAAAGK